MFNKCTHNWKIITESYEVAPLFKMAKYGLSHIKGLNPRDALGTKLIILQCEKCGVLDKTVEKM